MSMKYLGESFDLHCGGIDLVFPHHENEIAQSECATGKPFVHYWVHPEFLVVEGEKMSKSLGNFFTLRDLLAQGHSPQAIRYLLLSVHYRKQLNFTMDGLRQAESSIQRLEDFRQRMTELADGSDPCPEFAAQIGAAQASFIEAMDDDLNISAALGVIFDFIRSTYQTHDQGRISRGDARAAVDFVLDVDQVLGVMRPQPELLDEEIARRIEERQAARRRRDFVEADRIRDWLSSQGIQLEDTREGIRWKRIHKSDLTQN
jgi:cysteinyl-tRNA synthetase